MIKLRTVSLSLVLLCALVSTTSQAALKPDKPMPEVTPEFLDQGLEIYIQRCSFCHGLMGDGGGPAADYLDPRPRDFTLGTFKFRTTESGELPTDEDLFRTVSRGLTGTGMQSFDNEIIKSGLTEDERWAVIAFIKTFAIEFENPELDPVATGKVISLPKNQPPMSDELIAKGEEVFKIAKCWECHGKQGRGDGQKAFDRTDDWGFPIRIRNVTMPWKVKAGSDVEDIYMRFSSGILGTPMPSFVDSFTDDERWALATFIKSLQHQRTDNQVMSAARVEADLPVDPMDPFWDDIASTDIRLAGQVIAAPRWQNPSIDMVTVKVAFNNDDIAFMLRWDDPFKDASHDKSQELDTTEISKVGAYNSFIKANDQIPRQLDTFRDSVALQFPVKAVEGTKKPHFFRGSSSAAVQLWHWQADLAEQGNGVIESNARGWKQKPKAQKVDLQQTISKAVWEKGRWHVVMRRSLTNDDKKDVQFREGKFTPVAFNVWDGSNGEHGLIMSLSSWYYVFLEAPTPISVYVKGIVALLLTGLLGLWLRKKAIAEVG